MNRSDVEEKSDSSRSVPGTAPSHVPGLSLQIVRAVWIALVIPSIGLFVAGLPAYYQQLQRACLLSTAACGNLNGALSAHDLQTLVTAGFSVSGYAAVLTIFFTLTTTTWWAVGLLLFRRRSDDWLALLAAFFLVMFSLTVSNNSLYALELAHPVFGLPLGLIGFLGQVSLVVFLLLFPNGRLVPRWSGLILLLGVIFEFCDNFPSRGTLSFDTNWPAWLYVLVTLALIGAILFSQIYRYRRVSTPMERQQTKWIVFGVIVAFAVFLGLFIITWLIPFLANTLLLQVVWTISLPVAALSIPLAIGFSISRYRLYDIDTLINRAVVYGLLTISLALLYGGLIVALQALFQVVFNKNNAVAIVVSTLFIAALFQPLRRRIQQIIDRRFYRRKYDAARIVGAFSLTAQSEVDLATLSRHLVAVVEETMQPVSVSLWLRLPEHHPVSWHATPSAPSAPSESSESEARQ
jgi:hypothetical protein